jgi:hypothetical protein
LNEFLAWLEGSALGHAMRESGVWTYGVVNLFHILGVSSLFGSILLLDLRLLGVWSKVPLDFIARPAVPVAQVGFTVAITSGVCLLSSNATEYVGNPFLLIKFPAIALGIVNVAALNLSAGWKSRRVREPSPAERRHLSIVGGISIFSWLAAVSAGRMIGYW